MSNSASPISGPIPSSVAFLYASSMTADDRLLTLRRALVAGSQLADPPLGIANALVARVAQADGGDRDGRAVRVGPGHRSKRLPDPGNVACGVDLLLGDRIETVHLEHGADQRRGCNDRIAGSQQFDDARVLNDVVQQAVHLGETARRKRLPAKQERRDDDLPGVSEPVVYLLGCFCDGVAREEGRQRSLPPSAADACSVPITMTTVTMRRTRRVSQGRTVTSQLILPSRLLMPYLPFR